MKFNKSVRGFGYITFKDLYNVECSIQESSSVEKLIWLGVNDANPKIMASKTNEGGTGWVEYKIPDDVLLTTRMLLNPKTAFELGVKLLKFAIFKKL